MEVEEADGSPIIRMGALDLQEYNDYLSDPSYKSVSMESREVPDGFDTEGNATMHTEYDWSVQHYIWVDRVIETPGSGPEFHDYVAINPAQNGGAIQVIESGEDIQARYDAGDSSPRNTEPLGPYLEMEAPSRRRGQMT